MKITVNGVFGFDWGLQGTKLSYCDRTAESIGDTLSVGYNGDYNAKQLHLATSLTKQGPSHSKFLRCIVAYLTIAAPRYWWAQFDTYRVGVTELSQSTMHTIMSRALMQKDFERAINPAHLTFLNEAISAKDFDTVKVNLPEGFLQARAVCTNYQALRTMYQQRKSHKLKEWQQFCAFLECDMPQSSLLTLDGRIN